MFPPYLSIFTGPRFCTLPLTEIAPFCGGRTFFVVVFAIFFYSFFVLVSSDSGLSLKDLC